MATFITTIKFTQQGIKGIAETTKRAAALKNRMRKKSFDTISSEAKVSPFFRKRPTVVSE